MQRQLEELGYKLYGMNIKNWKVPGKKAEFGKHGQFRREIKEPGFVSHVADNHRYVALYSKEHLYFDFDWKDDFEPTDKQRELHDFLAATFPWYPSMTKKRWGKHILVPRDRFQGVVGEPKLPALCSEDGENIVEILSEKPAIIRASLLKSHSLNISQMSPPLLKIQDFGGQMPSRPAVRKTSPRSPIPRGEYKAHKELRKWVSHWKDERFDHHDTWFPFTCLAKLYKDKQLWEDKSKAGRNYNKENNEDIWNRLHDTSYTMGTAVAWAKEDNPGGCCSYKQVKEKLEADGFAIEKTTACLLHRGVELQENGFKRAVATYRFYCPEKEEMKDIYPAWIRDVERKEVVRVFKPYPPNQPDPTLAGECNTAEPFQFKYNPDPSPEPLEDFMKILRALCSSDDEAKYQLHFFAHILQKPRENPQVLVCNKGSLEGAGKDTACKAIGRLLGGAYFICAENPEHLFAGKGSQYNEALRGKLLVQLNEVQSKEVRDVWSPIKDLVTRERNTIHQKYKQPTEEPNYVRLLLASNDANPADVGRRPFITNVSLKNRLDKDFFVRWYANIEKESFRDDLGSALLNVNLMDVRKPPMTDVKQSKTEEKTQAIHRVFQSIAEGKTVGYTLPRSGEEGFTKLELLNVFRDQLIEEGVKVPRKDLPKKVTDAVNEFNEAIDYKPVTDARCGKTVRMYVFHKQWLAGCLHALDRWTVPEKLEEIKEMAGFF